AIFDKFLEVQSVSGVSKFLISRNIRSRSGNYFSLPGIKEILQNPAYCAADKDAFGYFSDLNADLCFGENDCTGSFGLLAYNKRDCKKKNAPRRSADQWIIAIGRHRGHIPGRKWAAVQKIIEDNIPTGKRPAKTHNSYALLSGIIRCEKCGNRMFAKPRCVKNSENSANGLYDYICTSKLRGGVRLCECPNIGGRQADELVCTTLARYAEESSRIISRLERLKQELLFAEKESPVSAIEAAIKKCSDEADNLISTLSQGDIGAAFVQRVSTRIAELDAEIKRLEAEKNAAARSESLSGNVEEKLSEIADELCDLKKSLAEPDRLSLYERRSIVRLLTKKIFWDGENMRIFIGGE
ncbi:MAG: recombinase family protein, partial [Oscillospiraceae bacterium]|nr:recombinase family protein [Oscillospiraceae bacterium]